MTFKKIALFFLAFGASLFANAQSPGHDHRTCASMEVFEKENADPQVAARRAALERDVQRYISTNASQRTSATTITIPVVVHVVYNTSTQNISDAQIQSQINILNADFAKLNSDVSLTPALFAGVAASADIQFCLAQRTPTGLSTNGITRTYTTVTSFSQNNAVKSSATGGVDPWDPTKYLNLWVCELGGGLLGYAQFPGGATATDGVVIGHFCCGNQGTAASPYDKGRTATHEIGHWLNLRHIWGDATCGDDFVADTPTQQASNGGCPSFPHPTCSNTSDMFMNYMDYTNDACMYMFTSGQASRMRAAISASRPGLLTSDGCVPSNVYCSGLSTFNGPSGTISDGSGATNYNNSTNCQWLIQPAAGATSITLTFTSFSTEASFDVVSVYNGTNTSGTLVGTYSGSTLPSAITITGGAMYVTFTSNGSNTAAGWSANYTSVVPVSGCSGLTTYTATSGTINDGSGANNYYSNSNCSYLIQAPAGSGAVSISFTAFDTESGYDYVRVYNGTSTAGTLIGSYSGSALPATIIANSGAAYITFITDGSITYTGWSLNYTYVPYCTGLTTMTTSSGSFTDGSGTNNYSNNSNCQWLIQPAGATSITLSFSSFATESTYDVVNVYNGTSTSGTLVGSYSGTSLPANLTITGSSMYVTFTSNSTVNTSGWSASYTSTVAGPCSGLSTYTAPSGTISDGSGTSNYGNYANCQFLIQPSGVGYITINFTSFNTESGWDFVKVYDGTSTSATLIGSYSGSTLPAAITTTGAAAYITFTSDGSITYQGWDLTYNFSGTGPSCSGLTTLTAASGTVTDGSGTGNYANGSNCQWLIQPSPVAQTIAINFTAFNTELNYDQVKIYSGTNASGTLLGTYSGTSLPSVVTINGSAAFVVFTTDASVTSTGWSFNYTSTSTGVATTQLLDGDVEVFPNPTDDIITIRVHLNNSATVNCKLQNTYGQTIWEKDYSQTDIEATTSLTNLPSGMYYVQVKDENGRTKVEKIVKR